MMSTNTDALRPMNTKKRTHALPRRAGKLILAAAFSALPTASGSAQTLFADSFDRPDNDDIEMIDSGPATIEDRHAGFGIDLSLGEINSFTDEFGPGDGAIANNPGPRGSVNTGGRGLSDFYCSVSLEDMVQVFANGVLVGEFPVDGDGKFGDAGTLTLTAPVNLRTDFAFEAPPTFAAGSFVYYTTYCNGLAIQ